MDQNKALFDQIDAMTPILEASQVNLSIHHIKSNRLWLPHRWCSFLGITNCPQGTFEAFTSRIYDADRLNWHLAVNDCIAGRSTNCDIELRVRNATNECRWVKVQGHVIIDGYSADECLVCTHRDVTESKRTHQFYKEIINALPGFVFVKDSAFRFTYVNDVLCSTIGLSKDKIIGHTDEEIFNNVSQVNQFRYADTAVLQNGQPVEVNAERLTASSGELIVLQTRKVPIILDDGSVGVLGVSTNISELNSVKRFLEKLMHCVGDGIVLSDAGGDIIRSNRLAKTAMQFGGASSCSTLEEFLESKLMQAATNYNHNQISEAEIEGEKKWFTVQRFPLEEESGDATEGYITVLKDITEIKNIKSLLEERNHLLEIVLDKIPQVISLKDKEGKYVLANAAAARLIGCSDKETMIGKTDFELCEDATGLNKKLVENWTMIDSRVVTQDIAVTTEETIGPGEYKTLLWRVPFREADGKVSGVLTISGS